MGNLIGMANAIKQVLMEEELKDISSKVRNGDVIKIILAQGGEFIFEIEGGVGGEFIIKDVNDGQRYTFGKDDFKNNILTVYPYTGGIGKTGGVDHKIKFMSIDVSGEVYEIDSTMAEPEDEPEQQEPEQQEPEQQEPEVGEVIDPELTAAKDDFNDTLLNETKVNDVLFIDTGIYGENGVFEEHAELEFVVVAATDTYIQVNLAKVSGSKSGYYYTNLNNKQIIFNKNKLVDLVDGALELSVFIKKEGGYSAVVIKNINSVGNNVKHPENETKPVRGMSKQSTVDYINQKYPDIWSKQPGLWDTIKGASPTGLYQIGQILNKNKVKNSYLKIGTELTFIVIGGKEIVGNYGITTLRLNPERDKGYSGTMYKEKIIKSGGDKNKVHWEIELLEETDENTYKVKYHFCTKEDDCTVKQIGSIKIIDIHN